MTSHTLIYHDPYRYIRYPAYAAYIIMSLGITIGYSSLVGLFSIPLGLFPGLIYRINVEERILATEFSKQYDQYVKTAKRLIPGIW
jgi:protein-S-isoprenylcysteine O-methyltransferase Ste14